LAAIVRVAGKTEEIAAKVLDMSRSGMRIEVPTALAEGAKVCVDLDQGLAFGEIRFCRRKAPDVYSAGFRLEEYICRQESEDTNSRAKVPV
jgi:hypothetical protein